VALSSSTTLGQSPVPSAPPEPGFALGAPVSATYGDATYTLVSLETWAAAPPPLSLASPVPDAVTLRAIVRVDNPLRTSTLWLAPDGLRLRREDGVEVQGTFLGEAGVPAVPGGSGELPVRFDVPGPFDPGAWRLVVGGPDRIVELLPLDGTSRPDPAYPLALPLEARGRVKGKGAGCHQPLRATVGDAAVAIDPGPERILPLAAFAGGDRRTLAGERFLIVHGTVRNLGGELCGGGSTNLDSADFALTVDGRTLVPVLAPNAVVAAGRSADWEVLFVVPRDADQVRFVIGKGRRSLAVPVPWSGLPVPEGEPAVVPSPAAAP
jgi:hypothetical protein